MKVWILVILVLFLLLASKGRELFQPTNLIKGPPYSDADYQRWISILDPSVISALQTQFKRQNPDKPLPDPSTGVGRGQLMEQSVATMMSNFYSQVYEPASQPLTSGNVDSFLAGNTDSIVSANRDSFKRLLVSYFVTPPAGAQNLPLTAKQVTSAGFAGKSGYADVLAGMGQAATVPANAIPSGDIPPEAVPVSSVTSTTTGGTSGIALGPTSRAASSTGQLIWGPEYPGMGDGNGMGPGGDSTSSRNYPFLLGPKPDTSTLSPAGIVPPSKSWQLPKNGSLPSPGVLGSTEDSRYFGTSRVPGDQDLIPDPYRVAAAFSTATYSSKTEPVPFLTDFSAFQK